MGDARSTRVQHVNDLSKRSTGVSAQRSHPQRASHSALPSPRYRLAPALTRGLVALTHELLAAEQSVGEELPCADGGGRHLDRGKSSWLNWLWMIIGFETTRFFTLA